METVSRMIANLVRAELLTNGGVMKVRQRARSAVYCERSAADSVFFLESGGKLSEDAGMFTKPWKQRSARYLAPSDDLLEYVCSQNNSGPKHMTGK